MGKKKKAFSLPSISYEVYAKQTFEELQRAIQNIRAFP